MSQPTPQDQMARMITGYWASQMVYVAAKLRIPDLLAAAQGLPKELARDTGTHAPSLYRLLRPSASTVTCSPAGVTASTVTVVGRETGTTTDAAPRERHPSSSVSCSSELAVRRGLTSADHGIVVRGLVDEDAPQDADLRRRQPDAASLLHQPRHALDELRDGIAQVFDLVCAHPQRRVRILADLHQRSPTPRFPLGVELFAPNLAFDLTHEGEKSKARALPLGRFESCAARRRAPGRERAGRGAGDGAEPGARRRRTRRSGRRSRARPDDEAPDQRPGDAEERRDDDPAGILSWKERLRDEPGEQAQDDPAEDSHSSPLVCLTGRHWVLPPSEETGNLWSGDACGSTSTETAGRRGAWRVRPLARRRADARGDASRRARSWRGAGRGAARAGAGAAPGRAGRKSPSARSSSARSSARTRAGPSAPGARDR